MSLLVEMNEKAMALGVPLTVHIDVTYRCNERCVHCYLDHDDHGAGRVVASPGRSSVKSTMSPTSDTAHSPAVTKKA